MRQRALRLTTTSTVAVLLAAALLVMVNWLGARRWVRGDWTSSRVYSLSEKSERILADLQEEVRVVVFMTPASTLYEQVRELLDRYAAASPKLEVEFIDPDREPLKTRQLVQQFGVEAANTVVFSYGERSKYVTSEQMAEYDYSGLQFGSEPSLKSFKGEEQFTAAILSLVAPRVPKVYFVTGHGEASLEATAAAGAGGASLRSLAEALRRENMSVAETSLLGGQVPEDADALAIVGPTRRFTEAEVALLGSWLDRGGRLLVCLDPDLQPGAAGSGLEPLLARHGLELVNDLVVDPSRRVVGLDSSAVYLDQFATHPVTRGLEGGGVAVLFPVARSVGTTAVEGLEVSRLVETTADGWGERDVEGLRRGTAENGDGDLPGPVAVAVAVERGAAAAGGEGGDDGGAADTGNGPAMRLVVLGDSDFMADDFIASLGNQALAVNAIAWLAAREEALGIQPRSVERVNLYLSFQQLLVIFLLTVVALPGAAIVAGVVVWLRRRH